LVDGCFYYRNQRPQDTSLKEVPVVHKTLGDKADAFPGSQVTGQKTVLSKGDESQTIVFEVVNARGFRLHMVTGFHDNSPIEYCTTHTL